MTRYPEVACRSALSPSRLPGLTYSLNPYIGCEHGCIYCYGPSTLRRSVSSWSSLVEVKANIVEALSKEVALKRPGVVGLGTVTDPYQPAEKAKELSRRCIQVLGSTRFRTSIQTKSDLVTRDLDIIRPERFELGVTITTLDVSVAKSLEPNAPPPDARAQALQEASAKKVPTWIFLGPVIPALNDDDENLARILLLAKETGSKIIFDKLNMAEGVDYRLRQLLPEPAGAHSIRLDGGPSFYDQLSRRIERLGRRLGVPVEPAFSKPLRTRQLRLS